MSDLVLGINLPVLPDGTITYDGNVALIDRKTVLTAVAEERISKKKYDGHVRCAVKDVLDRHGLELGDVGAISVVSFGQPMVDGGRDASALEQEVKSLFPDHGNIHFVRSHHEAHAISAVAQTGLDRALVVVIDHTGNIIGPVIDAEKLENNPAEQTSYYLFENGDLRLVARDHAEAMDQGYGRFYGDVTCYLGFNSYRESGKTMGLASFGDPAVLNECEPFVETEGGEVISALRDIGYMDDCTKDFAAWFKRQGILIPGRRGNNEVLRPFDMHLAAWAQDKLQRSVARRVKGLMERFNVDKVCVAGGVAMNSVMNRFLEEELGVSVYVPPSPGDAGLALGAAAEYFWKQDGVMPKLVSSPYLGPIYSSTEIMATIDACRDEFIVREIGEPELEAATAISAGKVVGWFQGRSEYGPRALGNRSILASPRVSWTKEILNGQIKLREWFRPYAPVVLEEKADTYFDMLSPVPYMMHVAPVKTQAMIDMPACIHVDGTARLQTVTEEANSKFHGLIRHLDRLTGVPVVLNTSFNLAGMPMVESPQDAIDCFRVAVGIDMLFVNNFVLEKRAADFERAH